MSDSARKLPEDWPLRSIRGLRHSADPLRAIESWLLKVAIPLKRGDIFQHKAVLSYLTLTYSCHVLPSCLQDAFKMAQDRNLGPTWAQLGPIGPHLGPIFTPKKSISCGRGCIFHFSTMRC